MWGVGEVASKRICFLIFVFLEFCGERELSEYDGLLVSIRRWDVAAVVLWFFGAQREARPPHKRIGLKNNNVNYSYSFHFRSCNLCLCTCLPREATPHSKTSQSSILNKNINKGLIFFSYLSFCVCLLPERGRRYIVVVLDGPSPGLSSNRRGIQLLRREDAVKTKRKTREKNQLPKCTGNGKLKGQQLETGALGQLKKNFFLPEKGEGRGARTFADSLNSRRGGGGKKILGRRLVQIFWNVVLACFLCQAVFLLPPLFFGGGGVFFGEGAKIVFNFFKRPNVPKKK